MRCACEVIAHLLWAQTNLFQRSFYGIASSCILAYARQPFAYNETLVMMCLN